MRWTKPVLGFLILSLLVLAACGGRNRTADKIAEDSSALEANSDSSLTFKDVTLEQFDEEGRVLWKVKARQARYSQDQKIAHIQNPSGELFQDGKLVFRIKALKGEVEQDGKRISLKEQIVATDTRDGVILRGKELEWLPEKDTLIVRKDLTGTHAQVDASAQEAKAFTRSRKIEFLGNVIAKTKDPELQLQAERLLWQVPNQIISSDRPVQVNRYTNKAVTETAAGGQAEVNLKTEIATLKKDVKLTTTNPPLTITTQSATWNVGEQTVASDQPIQVVHQEQQVNLSADRGQVDLEKQIFYLTGNVRGIGQRNQSNLTSDILTWFIPTQEVEAEGNVVYQQINPPFNLTGPKAMGKLQDQTIVVSGGQVITEIIP